MNTSTLPAHALHRGMTILLAGLPFVVQANLFDRHGGSGNQSLNLLTCAALNDIPSPLECLSNPELFGLVPSTLVSVLPRRIEAFCSHHKGENP